MDRHTTPCSLETFDRGLRSWALVGRFRLSKQCKLRPHSLPDKKQGAKRKPHWWVLPNYHSEKYTHVGLCWKLRHTQCSISHRMMVLGATDRFSCIVSLSKFYSSGDPLFLGDSPSPVFTAVLEKSHVRYGANRRCLQSNSLLVFHILLTFHDTEVAAKSNASGPCMGNCSPLTGGVLREPESRVA